ncbi:hypothetical protein CERSUDRAFT_159098 [Gelatoporia subvermispora B]|uniref:C2H2-type domain-containing protein n=1 Tax=Ceriporiopsis subvermispora (strain B) TaxID=914234 RepID=M2PDI2_CERS8|nr:hypothetical protein CERSUDRAFT_159098 [Gelatoporia subvermispora B]
MPYCERCERSFRDQHALDQHKATSSYHFYCRDCNRDLKNWIGLKEHYVQSPHHHYCQRCEDQFDSEDELIDHYKEVHAYCGLCRKVLKNERGLHEHNRQVHSNLYCVPCKDMFRDENSWRIHTKYTHSPKKYECPAPFCPKACVDLQDLMCHWECGSCDMSRIALKAIRQATAQGGNDSETRLRIRKAAMAVRLFGLEREDYMCARNVGGCDARFMSRGAFSQHLEHGDCQARRREKSELELMAMDLHVGIARLQLS